MIATNKAQSSGENLSQEIEYNKEYDVPEEALRGGDDNVGFVRVREM